jgi:adenylate cyclase
LLRQGKNWRVVARAAAPDAEVVGREFSISVLESIVEMKRTVFRPEEVVPTASLTGVVALVAAPVLTATGEVSGAVYGVRRKVRGSSVGITRLEAQMAQVLATTVGIGLARVEQEEELARLQVQFRQHFTDRIAQQLVADSGALEGQDRIITVLFADIRGFSRISERLGPPDTFRLVSSVLAVLTEAVLRHSGTVMDYVGDELIGLWNAPLDQADHAVQAVACARELEGDLAALNQEWEPRIGEPVRVGVGVNTGLARVGNTGTRYKFKYGALGHTVNLASRIQGATRAFGCPILLSGATREGLAADADLRRMGRVKVVGIDEPVELFQAVPPGWVATPEVRDGYERALTLFEAQNLAGAAEVLRELTGRSDDGAVRLLTRRVEQLLQEGATGGYAPIIELVGK